MRARPVLVVVVLAALGCTREARRTTDEPPPPPRSPASPEPAVAPVAVAAPGDAMSTPQLAVELAVTPLTLTSATRKDLMLTVTVKNLGPDLVDPEINLSELLVDGTPSSDWNMALGNSGRPKTWKMLPPGETVSGSVGRLADALFPQPGDYTLVLRVSGTASAPVAVRVTR